MKNNIMKTELAVIFVLITMTLGLTFGSAYSQSASNSSGASNQSAGGNASQGIGSAQQLMESLGNNTELLTNKTAVGEPNASLTEKMAVESNVTSNQTVSNQTTD